MNQVTAKFFGEDIETAVAEAAETAKHFQYFQAQLKSTRKRINRYKRDGWKYNFFNVGPNTYCACSFPSNDHKQDLLETCVTKVTPSSCISNGPLYSVNVVDDQLMFVGHKVDKGDSKTRMQLSKKGFWFVDRDAAHEIFTEKD